MSNESPQSAQRALICLGDGPRDHNALKFAKQVTMAYHLRPILLHVVEEGREISRGEKIVAGALGAFRLQMAETRVVGGRFEDVVQSELASGMYRLVVLGTTKRPPEQKPSPLVRRLTLRASTNVLYIKSPDGQLDNLLLCTAGHPGSVRIVDMGLQAAMIMGARATILHVTSHPPAMYTGLARIDQDLKEVLARDTPLAQHLRRVAFLADQLGVNADIQLRHGTVVEEIIRASEMEKYDIVVMGTAPVGHAMDRLLLGDIVPQVLASVPTSLLIVRSSPPEGP
jgi:nucleotide-binding universal stress UspA family protein